MSSATPYGTGSLASDDTLHAITIRRRAYVRLGVAAFVGLAAAITIFFGFMHLFPSSSPSSSGGSHTASTSSGTAATKPMPGFPADPHVECWQSWTPDGGVTTNLMERVDNVVFTRKAEANAAEQATSFVKIDPSREFQEIFGFGGAFTEAAGLQFSKLSKDKQEEVLDLYFNKTHGSGYTFGRVPMGSCDFSTRSYNYDNVTNDTDLVHFDMNVSQDQHVILPFIKRAMQKEPNLKLFLSPWSPPAWMKLSDHKKQYTPSMTGSAVPIGLNPIYQTSWALYFSKYISAYKSHGINFWGLTPQNEPEFPAPWEACTYTAEYEANFIAEYLGPIIRRDHPEVKIMAFDHNRGSVHYWAKTLAQNPKAASFIDGIAFHWYDGERYLDGVVYHEFLNDTHTDFPSAFLFASESCNCPGVAKGKDAWFRAQRYAHDIITDMNNWATGWIDWNLMLDHAGGPNHLGNNCDAPIIMDESNQNYFIQPMYYFVQHISKFVPPGSKRIHVESSVQYAKPGQDPSLFVLYPVSLNYCDKSSRQLIRKTEDSKLEIGHSGFCIDLIPNQWLGHLAVMVECRYTAQHWTFEDNGMIHMNETCLSLHRGWTDNGARIEAANCTQNAAENDALHQKWVLQDQMLHSKASPDKCATAGYSFMHTIAFKTPDDSTVFVALNENTEDAVFEIQVGDARLSTTVPKNGIRTFKWK